MKPVLHLLRQPGVLTALSTPLRPTLPALATSQIRQYASILGSLSDVPSAYNKRIRRGRGPSSGKGKTSGRGHKGQGQHGGVPFGFNGGQTKDIVVSGPRGFDNKFSTDYACLNLERLQSWIRDGRLDTSKPITITELVKSRCVTDIKDGVKLLGSGKEQWDIKCELVVSRVSKSAAEAIEKVGGKVTARFYNKSGLKYMANPDKHPELAHMRLADPTSRKDREYYRDPANRGYLAGTLKEGEVPNLYFKNREIGVDSLEAKAKKVDTSANRLF